MFFKSKGENSVKKGVTLNAVVLEPPFVQAAGCG